MELHPIFANGQALALEDVRAASQAAGTADDAVRVQLNQVFVEGTHRLAHVVPWKDGPIVVPAGATGKVRVQPFTAYRSPNGATASPGTPDASGGSETPRDLITAWFAGADVTVPGIPLVASTNQNWHLLYAIVSEADSDAATRLVQDVSGVIAAQTVNTRHGSSVTLAWVQGVEAPQATNPFPSANFPAMPNPATGQAHVPLAYVHVFDGDSGTTTFTVDRILNDTRFARINANNGSMRVWASVVGVDAGNVPRDLNDPKALITDVTVGNGGWPSSPSGKRPSRFIEQHVGIERMLIAVDFRSATFADDTWVVLPTPVATPDPAALAYRRCPLDWRNRWFRVTFVRDSATNAWAHDQSAAATDRKFPVTPTFYAVFEQTARGNTIYPNDAFDTLPGAPSNWLLAGLFEINTTGISRLAVLVRRTTSGGYTAGAMHIAAFRQAAAPSSPSDLAKAWLIEVEATTPLFPFGF